MAYLSLNNEREEYYNGFITSDSCKYERALQVSKRVRSTDDPVMVQARRLIGGVQGVASLAQGLPWLSH